MILSDVSHTSGRQAACAAGRLDGAYWLIGPGSAQGCRCTLPLEAWAGHIVAAAHLQLVVSEIQSNVFDLMHCCVGERFKQRCRVSSLLVPCRRISHPIVFAYLSVPVMWS